MWLLGKGKGKEKEKGLKHEHILIAYTKYTQLKHLFEFFKNTGCLFTSAIYDIGELLDIQHNLIHPIVKKLS